MATMGEGDKSRFLETVGRVRFDHPATGVQGIKRRPAF